MEGKTFEQEVGKCALRNRVYVVNCFKVIEMTTRVENFLKRTPIPSTTIVADTRSQTDRQVLHVRRSTTGY
jgi:hypothetical protein